MSRQVSRDDTLGWVSGLIARMIVGVFVAPFLLLGAAAVFALTASQVGELVATLVTVAIALGAIAAVRCWIRMCGSSYDRSLE